MREEPENWRCHLTEILREADGERIGYLESTTDDQWLPLNLLGMSLGDATDEDAAKQTVRQSAMTSLTGELWCKLPRPLVETVTDARQVGGNSWWERVVVVEINANRATIRPYHPMEEEQGCLVLVQLPAEDVMKFHEPTDFAD